MTQGEKTVRLIALSWLVDLEKSLPVKASVEGAAVFEIPMILDI